MNTIKIGGKGKWSPRDSDNHKSSESTRRDENQNNMNRKTIDLQQLDASNKAKQLDMKKKLEEMYIE